MKQNFSRANSELTLPQTTPFGSSPHKYGDRPSESSPHVVSSSPQVPSPHAQTLDLSVSR